MKLYSAVNKNIFINNTNIIERIRFDLWWSVLLKKKLTQYLKWRNPKLLYVSKAETKDTKLPRVMHVHENRLEILFIRDGRGIHTIGGKKYHTKKGDILIITAGLSTMNV